VNLILLETTKEAALLEPNDPRTRHIRKVLRMKTGDQLCVGVVNGPRGKAIIGGDDPAGLRLEIVWEKTIEPPRPFWVLAGLPRPQTARDVLREAATFGVTALHFFNAEKGEPSYADSSLWQSDEWKQRLREGAAQAFATYVPELTQHASLVDAVVKVITQAPKPATALALDVYEGDAALSQLAPAEGPVVLAVGAERGWSAHERQVLRGAGFTLAHLGPRVLRTETALVAGLSVLLARRGEF
jgi:RsmE family RNA methyltransferase